MVLAISHSPHSDRHLSPINDPTLQIRQTLSRSPSKGSPFRIFTSRTSSPTSPRARNDTFMDSTPLFTLSAKKRKQNQPRSPLRLPRSAMKPVRRALHDVPDHGNSGLQNMTLPAVSPDCMQISPDENLLAPHHALGRRERTDYFDMPKSSPLKRSEPNFDANRASSPSAKRRSLHGSSLAPDFNIMDLELELEDTSDLLTPTPQSPMGFRKSSLRRSTRMPSIFDTVPAVKSRPTVGNMFDIRDAMAHKRLSLDFPSPDTNGDSPFAFDAPRVVQPRGFRTMEKLTIPQKHPLARAISQSSTGSDIGGDSPTHAPVRSLAGFNTSFNRQPIEFTRSLPLGAARPQDDSSSTDSSNLATPSKYRLAKPHPAAFLSTGLISKKNRNLTTEEMDFRGSVRNMPDTPCKRPMAPMAPFPVPTPDVNQMKNRVRQSLHAFGTPSTPFNPQKSTTTISTFVPAVFGNNFSKEPLPRGSFADNIEEVPKSPLLHFHNRNRSFQELPPTPTKLGHTINDAQAVNTEGFAIMDSKSILMPELKVARIGELDDSCLSSPSSKLRFRNLDTVTSFSKRDARGKKHCPSPLSNLSTLFTTKQTKPSSIASPVVQPSPRSDSVVPPDPSNLSISGNEKKSLFRHNSIHSNLNQPATPTAARDSVGKFSAFNVSVTPSNPAKAFQIDPSITSRFHRVEALSTGEFSQVFKVTKFLDVDLSTEGRRASKGYSGPGKTYAVKKAKKPYYGARDRVRKLQEVEILKALGESDHTLQYFDHWEVKDYLFIQTEFCEEGTLQKFLDKAGRSARLDDFRIWKILLEMSKGLKHIHDSGFMHLDIKPANVLVSFEGALKIADFGMASVWPAPADIDGEGDREYIGPEVLEGKLGKPADIFAFGLMMVEIAGNVELPDNGTVWQRLRSGNFIDVPSLSSSDLSYVSRDDTGNPLYSTPQKPVHTESSLAAFDFGFDIKPISPRSIRTGELQIAPDFMVDPDHASALDKIARQMIAPEPSERPTVNDLLSIYGCKWVLERRRAGATVYEGNFGPSDDVLYHDSEMMDV